MSLGLVQFAEAACGVVQVMLNGSVEAGAFRSSRYSLSTKPSMILWGCMCLAACESQCRRVLVNSPLGVEKLILFTPPVQRLWLKSFRGCGRGCRVLLLLNWLLQFLWFYFTRLGYLAASAVMNSIKRWRICFLGEQPWSLPWHQINSQDTEQEKRH